MEFIYIRYISNIFIQPPTSVRIKSRPDYRIHHRKQVHTSVQTHGKYPVHDHRSQITDHSMEKLFDWSDISSIGSPHLKDLDSII